jgi:hypothetical protein
MEAAADVSFEIAILLVCMIAKPPFDNDELPGRVSITNTSKVYNPHRQPSTYNPPAHSRSILLNIYPHQPRISLASRRPSPYYERNPNAVVLGNLTFRSRIMDLETLRAFFMWCSIINVALLIFSFVICATGRNLIHSFHSRIFPMSEETFYAIIYSWLGLYKIIIFTFNIIPYIALSIIK